MKKIFLALLLSLLAVVYAETYTVRVTGTAYVNYGDERGIVQLDTEDILDDADEDATLIVQPNSKVTIEIGGRKYILKNGEYKFSDLFN